MTRMIWEFPLAQTDHRLRIPMPFGATLLHVGYDPLGALCVWALVDPAEPQSPRRLHVIGTGQPCDYAAEQYVGTVLDGSFMWHVFDGGYES